MKAGIPAYLIINGVRYLPAVCLSSLIMQLFNNSETSLGMRILMLVAGSGVAMNLFENVQLKERIARLEKLLTAFDPESATYRKEINDYDRHPTSHLILPPDRQ